MKAFVWGLALAVGPAWTAILAAPPESADVFVERTGGYFAYRIPAIETAADGSLLAFAEARKYNLDDPGFGNQDIDLVCRRSHDGGKSWSPMKVIEDPGERWSAANPATVVDRTNGRVWLLYLRCKPGRNTDTARPGTDDSQVLARTSDDNGTDMVRADRPDPRLARLQRSEVAVQRRRAGRNDPGSPRPAPGGVLAIRAVRQLCPVQRGPRQDLAAIRARAGRCRRRVPARRAGERPAAHGHSPGKRRQPVVLHK